jgi:purine-binding chemotaxis protein CheW
MAENKTAQSAVIAAPTTLLATFQIRDAVCALDAAGIQEVIRLGPLTKVHHAPESIAGIVNLRGKIVTVIDLGLRLGFPAAGHTAASRILIMEESNEFIGLLVDRVDEVVETRTEDLQAPPANLRAGQARFLKGICRAGGRVVTLLNASAVLSDSATLSEAT